MDHKAASQERDAGSSRRTTWRRDDPQKHGMEYPRGSGGTRGAREVLTARPLPSPRLRPQPPTPLRVLRPRNLHVEIVVVRAGGLRKGQSVRGQGHSPFLHRASPGRRLRAACSGAAIDQTDVWKFHTNQGHGEQDRKKIQVIHPRVYYHFKRHTEASADHKGHSLQRSPIRIRSGFSSQSWAWADITPGFSRPHQFPF